MHAFGAACWLRRAGPTSSSEGCNNSKSGRGALFQPRLSREYTTKQAEITPSLVGIGGCVMNSKGRYHAHALVAFLTASDLRMSTSRVRPRVTLTSGDGQTGI